MAALSQHLRILLWKNWLSVKRQPVWSFILISWPVVVFIILAIIRLKFPPEPQPNCYLAPRNLPSAGFFPFLQTVLCDSDARCKGTPYTPEDLLPRLNDISSLRLKQRSSFSAAKDNHPSPWSAEIPKSRNASLAFGDLVFHGEKTLRNISSPSNLTSSINVFNKILNFGKNQTQYSTAANLKVILCEVLARYIAHPILTEEKMAANIHQTFCFTDSSLLESFTQEFKSQLSQVQHNAQYQAAFVNEMVSFLMLVSQVQNDTSLWHLLLLAPDVFQGSMQLKDIIDFLQNPSSVVLAAQNVSALPVTDDRFKTVQNGVTDPPYSLNCLEQDKEENMMTRYICNHFVNWKDNQTLVSELEEVLRKIKSPEIGGKDSKRSINSGDLEAIQKSLHRLKGFEKKMNRSELKSLTLFRNLKNETLQKLYAILELGMNPHHDYKLKEPYNKEIIDEIYNFTSLQLQSDFNGTSIFNIMTQWKEIQSALKLAAMIWNPVLLNNSNFSTAQTKDPLKMLLSTSMPSFLEDFRDRLNGMHEILSLFSDYLLKPVSYRNFPDQLLALQKMFFIMTDTNIGYQYLLMPVFELMRRVESSMSEAWWDELNAYWRIGEKLRSMKWNNTSITAYGQFLEVLNSHLQKLNNNPSSVFSGQLDQLSEFITAVFKEFGENSEVANISLVSQAIQKTLYILKDLQLNYNVSKLKSIDIFFNFDNKTFESLSELLRTEMKILHYTSASETSSEEIINPVYNLTHLLLQEFSQYSSQHNTSLEAKIWEFLHVALSPFLEKSNNGYRTPQNCSAQDILHITLEMLFENATLSKSLAGSPCKPLFDSMGMEGGRGCNDTFTKMFQLAITNLKLSPELAAVYKNSSECFSKELSCIIQSLQFTLSFLSKLNLVSELENSWVQEKVRALTAVTEGLLQSNASCPVPVQDVGGVLPSQLLNMLLPFMLSETVLNSLNVSDSSADWHRLPVFSHLLQTVFISNSSIYELLQVGRNSSNQSEWRHLSQLWHATGNMLTTKWNLTEVGEYVKLLEIMKKALILVDFGVAPGKTLVYQIFHNSSGGIKPSDLNYLYSSLKLFFNSTSATNSTLDLERIFQEIFPLYEVDGEGLFYPNPYGEEIQDVLTMAAVIWNQTMLKRTHFNTEKAWEVIRMIGLHAVSLEDTENYLSTNEKVSSLFSDFLLTLVTSENFAEQLLSLEQLLAAMAKLNTSDHYLLMSSLSKLMQKLQSSPHGRQGNELHAFWHIVEVLQSMNWDSTDSLTTQSLLDMLQNQFSTMKNDSSLPFSKELKQWINFVSFMFELYGKEDSRGMNISIYSQAMQSSILILKGLQKSYNISELETISLLLDSSSNYTQRLIEIWRAGMKVLHDTNLNKTFEEKMDIVYHFSHLLLQKEFSQYSSQHNTSLEAKIWEFLHVALSPFLEKSNNGYRTPQNCSAQDILHITLEMLFENATLSKSLAGSPCKPLFDSMGMEGGRGCNDTFTKMFQLAITNLKLSPELAAVYKNSSECFSKELSCIIQSLQFTLSFLSKLNLVSELENSWVQEKVRALTAVTEGLLQSNASCPVPVQDVGGVLPSQLLNMLLPFMLSETVLNSLNVSDSSADWHRLPVFSHLLQTVFISNSSIYELLQVGRNSSNQSEWRHLSQLWHATGNMLTTKWNLTEVGEYVKLLEIMKKALILVDFGVAPGKTLVYQIFHNSSGGIKPSDLNYLYSSLKLFFNSTSATNSTLDLERIFQEIFPLYEVDGEGLFYPNPYGEEIQDVLTMAAVIWNQTMLKRTHFNTEKAWEVIRMIGLHAVSLEDTENYLSTNEKVSSLFSDFLLTLVTSENFAEQLLSLEQLLAAMAKLNTSDHYLLMSSLSKLMQKLQSSPHGRQGNELHAFWHIVEVLQSMNWDSTDSLTTQSLLDMLQNQFSTMKNDSSLPFSKELKQWINFVSFMFELYGKEDSRGMNISIYSQAMQSSILILKGLQKSYNISELETISLLLDSSSNYTQRLIEIWRAGMKVLHDTNLNKTFEEKMDIVYHFSHLLLQKEFSQYSSQHNTSLEAKIWEFLHVALSPFLEKSNNGYRTPQNCSAQDILHITLEMLFENATLSKSLAGSPCKPLFDSMGMEGERGCNDTFTKMFQLAITNLKLSPELAAVYKNSSECFSKELSCIIQSLQFTLSFLSKLNLVSELENSWVQEKVRALTAVTEGLLQSNASCPVPVQDVGGVLPSQLLNMLLPFMLSETVLNSLNVSDSLAGWNNLSMLSSVAQDELHMSNLLQRLQGTFSLTKWSYYSSFWDVVDSFLNTKRNLTEAAAFAKLLEAVANNSANDVSALEITEASRYILKRLNSSDLLNEFNIHSSSAFLSNKTSFDSVIDIVARHFIVMAEALYNKTLPWTQSDKTLSPTSLITRFLFLEFENTILQVTVNNSYNPYLMCLINAAEIEDRKLTENTTLLLKQAHLKKNPFMQNNTSEKYSSIPELLKLKISRLRDLTTLLCDYESFKSIQHICHLPNVGFGELCEQSQSHEQLLRTIELSNQIVTNVLNHRRISQELQNILIGDATNIQTQMKWLQENVPEIAFFQEIPQSMSTLNSVLNITENLTDSSKQEKLRNVFKNVDQLKEDLRNTAGMSTASIDALLEASLPENSSQLISQILQLESCSIRPADPQLQTVAEEFCNLSLSERTRETYILGVTLLRHLDIYNFLYKMFFPKELQKPVDKMLGLLTKMKYFRHQVESGVDPLLQAIHSLKKLRQARNVPLTKELFKSNNFRITRDTFKSMSKVLCNQEITPLFFESLLPDFGDPVSNSSSVEDVYVQKMMRKYGIPHDSTPFCLSFYLDLVKTPSGALIWSFLKPMVLGKILYTPDTIETQAIMGKSNATLKQMADLALKSQEWLDKSPVIMNSLTKLNQTVPMIKNTLQNPFVQVFIKLMVDLDAAELLSQINKLDDIRLELQNNVDIVNQLNTLATLAVNVSSCVSFNRIQAVRNLEEMEMVAKELFLKNELFASIIFKLPSSRSSPGRSVYGHLTLPPVLNYTIRMSSRITQTTNRIRERIWTVGPHNSTSQSQIYSRAFIYIQDSIERAIIELQTGKNPEEIAVQVQAMPYPCYNKDMFLTSVTYSLPFALMAAWVLFIADFVKTLVQEKDLRLYEYMKMMGVNASSHFIAWFIECAIFLLITITFLIIVLKVGDILPKTNTVLLFLYLTDYSLSIIAMSYFISVFFNNTNIAALVGSLVYILTFFPFIVLLVIENHLSFSVKSLLSLLSPTAFSYASQYIARYEAQGIGLQWDNMYKSPMIGDNTSFGWMCWLILIDSFIYFILGWYIRNVFPGRYGMAAPWYFPLLPSYWVEYNSYLPFWNEKQRGLLFTKLMLRKEATLNNKICAPPPHLEPEPTDLTLGVSLCGITKVYGSKAAVDNLSLNFYEGNITSLLGHNGAGKTTTISILTGLFPTSSGTIFVYGKDIRTDQEVIRKNMGVCMQHNVLFNYLTTKEHLLLYGYIKVPHWSKQELYQEVKRTLKETGLYSHRHKLAGSLSGGTKRKLSIAIALLGGSRVVILDEPTTGVDPCSRRSIWEIISKNKKGRTIILSTHHLDEAEVLSDRIAFLEHGGLKCCGSPFYLKETFGDGYHLTLTKKKNMIEECDTTAVTSLIQSHLPEAYLKEDIGGELVYVLPPFKSTVSGAYQALLRALDTSLSDLHLGCYGISNTTVEEVFLNLTKELVKDKQEDAELPQQLPGASAQTGSDEMSMSSDTFTERDDQLLIRSKSLQGLPLLLKKTSALFIKRFHHTRRDVRGFIAQIVLPVLFVMAAMGLGTLRTKETEYPELILSPSLYGTSDQADFFGNFNETTDALVTSMLAFPGTDNTCMNESNSQCLKEDMLGQWIISGNQRTKYSACNCTDGIQTCPQTNYTPPHRRTFSTRTLYNLTGHNVETYILATTKDFLQKRYGGWSFGLPLTTDLQFDIKPVPPNRTLTKVWYNPEGYHSLPAYLNSLNNFILRANLPKNETSRYGIILSAHPYPGGQSQEQVMLNSLLDIIVSMSVLVGYSITTASFVLYVVKEHQTKAKQLQHISGIGMTSYWVTNFIYDLVLFMVPIGLSIGVISSFQIPAFCNNNNLLAVFLLLLLFGYATFSWMYLLAGFFKETGMAFIVYVCVNLFFGINTIITHSVVFLLSQEKATDQGLRDLAENLRHVFLLFPQFCFGYGLIELSQDQALLGFLKAYGVDYPNKTFELDKTTSKLFAMFIQGTVFFAIRLMVHDRMIQRVWNNILQFLFDKVHGKASLLPPAAEEDGDVQAERNRVESGKADFDVVQLQNLTKVYHLPHKRIVAVKNISLGIPAGECFGLLGVNGAGKTTIFKMLTGDIGASSGTLRVQDHSGSLNDISEAHWSLFGYCPQEDALDDLLTVEEHMYYYARLHGIPEREIKGVVLQLLHRLNMMAYKDRVTSMCSYGTNRKLSTALALIGNPSILLLDEPSSGMDPNAKRHLWKIISEEVQNKCSVILTSHSMEECEALCTRLAIMVNGSFQCIGSLQHIKSRFGRGFTVKMHLNSNTVCTEMLTEFMKSHFPNTCLKDQHFNMVEYHVPVSAGGVANIFDLLEASKAAFNIRHFSVSQTTLEEVFINFAKDQADPHGSDAGPNVTLDSSDTSSQDSTISSIY